MRFERHLSSSMDEFIIFLILVVVVTLITPSLAQPPDNILITQQDLQGLQSLKHSFSDPLGFLRSWNGSGIAACSGSWHGVKCAHGHVIAISLPWRALAGHISTDIGQLAYLRKLSLHDNSISGPIPPSLFSLRHLRGVYLFNNAFSGSIPVSISNCILLQALDLSNNLLIGIVPDSISNLTCLYRLNLGHNNLSGSIPGALDKLPAIEELILSNNDINGSIPNEIGSLLKLKTLDLSENKLSGGIPESFHHLLGLSSFNVSYNNLSGPVPDLLANKFTSSSFTGNAGLCGYNSSVPCVSPNLPSDSSSSSSSSSSSEKSSHWKPSVKTVVLIVAGVAIGVLFSVCCVLFYCLLRKNRSSSEKGSEGKGSEGKEVSDEVEMKGGGGGAGEGGGGKLVHFDGSAAFTADSLLCATAEILGKSTYGTVYRAALEDGDRVAVKRLREKYARSQKEFEVEVNLLGKVRHENLLEVRAYYMGPKGEKLLVFDFMPKGSLAAFLHARGPDTFIDWPTRLQIATGVARALNYLHNSRKIIHGNLTGNNILLDENYTNPKVSDFGLHRLMTPAANSNAVAAAAALGYRAPELHNLRKASTKTDIYSFGVVLLELLTGKSPAMNNGMELPQWAASVVEEEWTGEVFDPELMRDGGETGEVMVNALKLALRCTDMSPAKRPEVGEVLEELEVMLSGEGRETGETSMAREGGES